LDSLSDFLLQESWGFCLSQRQLEALTEDEYEINIDSTLKDGHLTYGEYFSPGNAERGIGLLPHVPSVFVQTTIYPHRAGCLAGKASERVPPATIPIAFCSFPARRRHYWLALNEDKLPRIKPRVSPSGVGMLANSHYKKSRQAAKKLTGQLLSSPHSGSVRLCNLHRMATMSAILSPGINACGGEALATPHGTFPEYDTSADNLEFVYPDKLGEIVRCLPGDTFGPGEQRSFCERESQSANHSWESAACTA